MPDCLRRYGQSQEICSICTRLLVDLGVRRQVDAALVRHLEEQQVGQLLDVVAVVHAVVAQDVAEAPEFPNDVGHAATSSLFRSAMIWSSWPPKTRFARPQPPWLDRIGHGLEVLPVDREVLYEVQPDVLHPLLLRRPSGRDRRSPWRQRR